MQTDNSITEKFHSKWPKTRVGRKPNPRCVYPVFSPHLVHYNTQRAFVEQLFFRIIQCNLTPYSYFGKPKLSIFIVLYMSNYFFFMIKKVKYSCCSCCCYCWWCNDCERVRVRGRKRLERKEPGNEVGDFANGVSKSKYHVYLFFIFFMS